jgi:putative Holliday junction resolvase
MRRLGLDVGERRIGVARTDETGAIATPYAVIEREGRKADVIRLQELARAQQAQEVVVGLPVTLRGEMGPQARQVRRFVSALRAALDVPVVTWDERFSTSEAERSLLEADVSRAGRRERVDKVAAALILQSYLDAKARQEG